MLGSFIHARRGYASASFPLSARDKAARGSERLRGPRPVRSRRSTLAGLQRHRALLPRRPPPPTSSLPANTPHTFRWIFNLPDTDGQWKSDLLLPADGHDDAPTAPVIHKKSSADYTMSLGWSNLTWWAVENWFRARWQWHLFCFFS